MTILYKSLVRSLLDRVLLPTLEPYQGDWNTVDSGGAKNFHQSYYIGGPQHLNYNWERLVQFKWMSLQRRRESYIILMMRKILHNVVPNCCDIKFKVTSRHGDHTLIVKVKFLTQPVTIQQVFYSSRTEAVEQGASHSCRGWYFLWHV